MQLNPGTKALRTGKRAPPQKTDAFDQMEDVGEPVLADDPPLEEEEQQNDNDDDNNDIGIIGQQPGDNLIVQKKTLVN